MRDSCFLQTLEAGRRDLLDHLVRDIEADGRVRAAWLGGSFGRGTADAWSDLDLYSAVRDEDFESWLAEREALYRRIGEPLLIGPRMVAFASPSGVSQSILFSGPVTVDWEAYPVSAAFRHPDTRVLFDKAGIPLRTAPIPDSAQRASRIEADWGFFWAMTPVALKQIGRGRTHRAVTMIDLLTETYARLWRLVHEPGRLDAGGAEWLHPAADAALRQSLPRLGRVIDQRGALDVVRLLMAEVMALQPAIAGEGVAVPVEAAREVTRFGDAVAREIDGEGGKRIDGKGAG